MEGFKIADIDNISSESDSKDRYYNTLPWTEKYRPSTLDGVVSQTDNTDILKKFIKNNCMPHLLFYGVSGTGKTSTITACAQELYGEYTHYMKMELNASDDRGIEVVRNKIKQFVSTSSVYFGKSVDSKNIFKLVILDEIDAMTQDAQATLRNVVEKYTNTTRFCLICNYIQKINPALQSRCTKFRFPPLKDTDIRRHMISIAKKENVKITKSGIENIIKRSNGDMRYVLNTMQTVSMSYDIINDKNVNNCLGYPHKQHIVKLYTSLLNDSFLDTFNLMSRYKHDKGFCINDILCEIHDILIEDMMSDTSSLSKDKTLHILRTLGVVEYNQHMSSSEDVQISSLISVFKM